MTNLHRAALGLVTALGLSFSFTAPASAQRLGLSVGYTRMTGRLGSSVSTEGLALRLGADLNPRSIVRFAFEGGMERLNEDARRYQTSCFHPAGGTATCNFFTRERDTGWSLAAVLRAGPTARAVRPYALAGVQFLSVRTRNRGEATDSTGAHLTNFESDGTYTDSAIGAPLGAGVLFRPAGSPFGVSVEGRATLLLHNYSGGPQFDWNPSLVLGVRWGG